MKYNTSNIIGDAGEHLVAAKIIKLFGFPCRLINIDIGIDAEIEIIDDNRKSTGQFIKSQIKTTTSDKMFLYLDCKHINYWNKLSIPVVIFLVHINSENIYWHIVENITDYKKSDSGYKVEFSTSKILTKDNKEKFQEVSLFPLKQEIKKRYEESYAFALEDTREFLDTRNYDLVTFEEFVFHTNKINFNLEKVEQLYRKNESLREVYYLYKAKLSFIQTYLDRIEEEKAQILIDHGDDFFDHLEKDNWNWD